MSWDFDKYTDRRGTDSLKWDWAVESGYPADVLPLWVADMDFPAPPAALAALRERAEHGIFGYSDVKGDYYEAVAGWFRRRHGLDLKREWLVKAPGVVFTLYNAVRAATREGEGVLIQRPVYRPFTSAIVDNRRRVVNNPLRYENGRYSVDFEDFEAKIVSENVKLFILCSPHNPVGRVWTAEELRRMGEICLRHGVYVVADEIHCDFALPGFRHVPFFEACPVLTDRTILCTAPSKTFNLAGLQCANIWIPGEKLRRRFLREYDLTGYSELNPMGMTACRAAYRKGAEWLDGLRAYLKENLDFLRDYLSEKLPEIRLVEPEGTYFAWLDMSGLGLSPEGVKDLIVNRARLWLDDGDIFGEEGALFQRVVLACPRSTLREALDRLEKAIRE